MATNTVPKVDKQQSTPQDSALLAAWRRFMDYDRVSTQQKALYQRIRSWVIVLGLTTSTGAVISTYLVAALGPGALASELLRILLIILPIISVALLNYANQFASSVSWIEYRVGAEMIRSQIYMYRLKAGAYKDKSLNDSQKHLLAIIHSADVRIEEKNATLPYQQTIKEQELIDAIAKKTDATDDRGIEPLTVEKYINYRLKPQIDWYIQKITTDYEKMRRERIFALVVAGAGSVLSGIGLGLEALVAVTTAMGVALMLMSDMRMYGATYGIFHVTSSQLQTELNQWEVKSESERTQPEEQKAFVENIERIFANEREMWRSQAIQAQMNAEQSLSKTIQHDTTFNVQMDEDNIPVYAPNMTKEQNRGSSTETMTVTAVPNQPLPPDDPIPVNGEQPAEPTTAG